MRIAFLVMAAVALSACQPNDTKVKTARELLDEGEVLEFTEPGFRHKGCRNKPNSDLRVTDDVERTRIVLGKQGTIISPGIYNCYRVGSRVGVYMERSRKRTVLPGEIIVSKISWARIEKVTKSRMKGRHFQSSEQFNSYLNDIKRVLEIFKTPYVAIVEFQYVGGSAVDEKALVEQENEKNSGDGFQETTEDGKCLGRCPNRLWTDTEVPTEFQAALVDKSLGSWFQLREQTGFQQGAEILLKTDRNHTEGFARARIKKVKRFRYSALNERFFNFDGFAIEKLRTYIQLMNVRVNSEWVTVIDLEILPPVAGPEQKKADCSKLHLNRELPLAGEIRVRQTQNPCGQPGSLLNVVTVDRDESVLEIPVRVKARLDDKESTTTTLILERLDQAEQELR